jgi:hypothetical protein
LLCAVLRENGLWTIYCALQQMWPKKQALLALPNPSAIL